MQLNIYLIKCVVTLSY